MGEERGSSGPKPPAGPPRRPGGRVWGEKFRIMLRLIKHPDGGQWTGTKMERASGGRVGNTYFAALRDGHVEIPGADKIEAIAEAMGFPPALWFKDVAWWHELLERRQRGEDVARALRDDETDPPLAAGEAGELVGERLERLFRVVVNEETGEPYTNADVAASSRGRLTEADVEAIREGRDADPTWESVLALCDVFGVEPSYFTERAVAWRPSAGVLRGVEDQESYVTFRNSLNLSARSRSMLRILSEHLKESEEQKGE